MFALPTMGIKHVDGGDKTEYDFVIGDLTRNGAWHDLDLSTIIPKNAKLVHLHVTQRNGTSGYSGQFRKKGNSNAYNNSTILCPYAAKTISGSLFVVPNTSGIIEYKFDTGGWAEIDIQVLGWFV